MGFEPQDVLLYDVSLHDVILLSLFCDLLHDIIVVIADYCRESSSCPHFMDLEIGPREKKQLA